MVPLLKSTSLPGPKTEVEPAVPAECVNQVAEALLLNVSLPEARWTKPVTIPLLLIVIGPCGVSIARSFAAETLPAVAILMVEAATVSTRMPASPPVRPAFTLSVAAPAPVPVTSMPRPA
jgi:hypothetical protein